MAVAFLARGRVGAGLLAEPVATLDLEARELGRAVLDHVVEAHLVGRLHCARLADQQAGAAVGVARGVEGVERGEGGRVLPTEGDAAETVLQADEGLAAEQPPALLGEAGRGIEAALEHEQGLVAVAEVLGAAEAEARSR